MMTARRIRVRGVVQGVGFRPFVFRLACQNALAGWVLNEENGVQIHLEGPEPALDSFIRQLYEKRPAAAHISAIDVAPCEASGAAAFTIRESVRGGSPTTRISPDLPVCSDCLREMRDPADPRCGYPYINCTNCGPRYSVMERLPYDRVNTTMRGWTMDRLCLDQYNHPEDRRFHAEPTACPSCGPHYSLEYAGEFVSGDRESIRRAAQLLNAGKILAVKGIGGYHLACDASLCDAVREMRERKYRKDKPFALMVRDLATARELLDVTPEAEALLCSTARPVVLGPKRTDLPEVAPDNSEFGVMLPYAPLHHLLFDAGAPSVLVMTSANRSSEPIAYTDEDARSRLAEIADGFLTGERPIARRVEDSIVRAGVLGPVVLRRARGYAPGATAHIPCRRPILALGADLKNTITLVVAGQAFVSQHIGDLDDYESRRAFEETIRDLASMYDVQWNDLIVVHDQHPQYASAGVAAELPCASRHGVQHHRAHIASVLAEREAWEQPVIGVSFDGTGYGDDGTIWGGEIFRGTVRTGFERVMHLRPVALPGGDSAAVYPVQSAAGFLSQLDDLPDLTIAPFHFPPHYRAARRLAESGVRTFTTTSVGRLFDAAAAILGFTRGVTFEGQAAMWLEHLARGAPACAPYPFPVTGDELDFRPLLRAAIHDRRKGRGVSEIARAFHAGLAEGLCGALEILCAGHGIGTVVLSGGVFQNELLLEHMAARSAAPIWTNSAVPPNDGGISLGQAAIAAAMDLYA